MANARIHFQAAVEGLKEQLCGMGDKAEQIIDLVVRCYFRQEPSLSLDALSLATEMNRCARQIDEIGLQLFSSKQLTPTDTSHLMAYMKINLTLEWIGALAMNTADLSLSFNRARVQHPTYIPKLGLAASGQLRRALQALSDADGDLAASVIEGADVVVLMGNEAWLHLVEDIKSSPDLADQAFRALMIAGNLEKIADHAKSIAQLVVCGLDRTRAGFSDRDL